MIGEVVPPWQVRLVHFQGPVDSMLGKILFDQLTAQELASILNLLLLLSAFEQEESAQRCA